MGNHPEPLSAANSNRVASSHSQEMANSQGWTIGFVFRWLFRRHMFSEAFLDQCLSYSISKLQAFVVLSGVGGGWN